MPGGPAEEPDGAEGKEEPAAGQGLEDMPVWKEFQGLNDYARIHERYVVLTFFLVAFPFPALSACATRCKTHNFAWRSRQNLKDGQGQRSDLVCWCHLL